MIPLRVKIAGFLSFRDAVEIDFREASLWMLTGANGTGKSTIFDAMTLALYGAYRGSKQNHRELINHGCNKLIVEFEFQLAQDVYRACRVISRSSSTVQHIVHVSGPNPPIQSNKKGILIEPDTDTDKGFENWIAAHIRLNDKAFTASMLLQQGHADALIEMKPSDRFATLEQLVDLSAYKKLYEKVDSRQKQATQRVEECDRNLQRLPAITEGDLDALRQEVDALQKEVSTASSQIDALTNLKVWAATWSELSGQRDKLLREQEKLALVIARETEIERDAESHEQLREALPKLKNLFDARQQFASIQAGLGAAQHQLQQATDRMNGAAQVASEAEAKHSTCKTELELCEKEHSEVQIRRANLAATLQIVSQIKSDQSRLAEISQGLSGFDAALDEQQTRLESEILQTRAVREALPLLKQFSDARAALQSATTQEVEAQKQTPILEGKIAELKAADVQGRQQLEQSQVKFEARQAEAARCKAQRDQWQERANNLLAIGTTASTCPHCGQPLSAQHLARERESVQASLAKAHSALADAERNQRTAKSELSQRQNRTTQLQKDLQEAEAHSQKVVHDLQRTRQDKANASNQLAESFASLLPHHQTKIADGPATPDQLMGSSFPTTQDMALLRADANKLDGLTAKLAEIKRQVKQRDDLTAQQRMLLNKLSEIEYRFPYDRIQKVEAEARAVDQAVTKLAQQITNHKPLLRQAANKLSQAQAERERAEQQRLNAQTEQQKLESQQHVSGLQVQSFVAALLPSWQGVANTLTRQSLASHQQEYERLKDAPQTLQTLRSGQQRKLAIENDLLDVDARICDIPDEAKVSMNTLDAQLSVLLTCSRQMNDALANKKQKLREQQGQYAERVALEQEQKDFLRTAQLCKELSQLLGQKGLQEHLLEQTNRVIVDNANAILDGISNGMLRLEFQDAAGAAQYRTSNIVAYNAAVGAEPIPLRCLSGGQRFRVSVALALGIGQYATREAQQVEAVIMDEGFGSLDEAGRGVMIETLGVLQSELKRIIIVSHEPEFAKQFSNRYEFSFENGTSRFQLV